MNAPFKPLGKPLGKPLAKTLPAAAEPAGDGLTVKVARTLDDLMKAMTIRALVYMGEQVCPFDEEFDGNDFSGATHLLLFHHREPIGVVRLRWFNGFAKLERLAIRADHRGGRGLMVLTRAAVRHIEAKGYSRMMGHAQTRLVPFWKRYFHGRIRPGRPSFSFSGYDYVELEFDLHPPGDAIGIDSDPLVLLRPEGDWSRPGVLDRSAAQSARRRAD